MSKTKSTAGTVSEVVFTVPAFRYKGKEYKSADVQKAAEEGDEDALAIIANLVNIGSGNVKVVGESVETDEPMEPKHEADEPKPKKGAKKK
jgi:hypothetical protein